MSYTNDLKEQIEFTRQKMYQTYKKNPDDTELLIISQSLDKLLNELEGTYRGNLKK
ncbi:Spo0E family sporulation regulatory protein-aspartic acid phosphatase [Halobacillus seohaensis]|uniref:Spo0E family sporulation regulatory protein-aspartic acid phosphatase n=1 Tax=Halobacillus seohaensis TaxID=447421 RepID=A0ABW2EJ59_9BACI